MSNPSSSDNANTLAKLRLKIKIIKDDDEAPKGLGIFAIAKECYDEKVDLLPEELLRVSCHVRITGMEHCCSKIMPLAYELAKSATSKAVKQYLADRKKPGSGFWFGEKELVDSAFVSWNGNIYSTDETVMEEIRALQTTPIFKATLVVNNFFDGPPILDEANILALKAKLDRSGSMTPTSSTLKRNASAMESPDTSGEKRLRVEDASEVEDSPEADGNSEAEGSLEVEECSDVGGGSAADEGSDTDEGSDEEESSDTEEGCDEEESSDAEDTLGTEQS
jgi:hypothetical protein